MAIKKIAILGAGNGGCAAAADLTLRGFEVRLFSRKEETLLPINKKGGIVLIENGQEQIAAPFFVSPDLPFVIASADLIVVTVPALAHEYLARELAKCLEPGQIILLNPGHTGGSLHFANVLRSRGAADGFKLCETVTLTYICRMPQPATVEIYRRTTQLRFAAFPGKYGSDLIEEVKVVFPNIVPAKNVLETGFANINAIMHPAGMLGNLGWIQHCEGEFLYYREGITSAIGIWIEEVDRERLEIVKRLGLPMLRFVDIFHQAGLTTDEAKQSGSAYRAIHESAPNMTIKAPPSLEHRYLHEDVGFGLVPMAEIGRLLGVKTPVIDALITLASSANRVDYRKHGLTLEKMGLSASRGGDLTKLLWEGF